MHNSEIVNAESQAKRFLEFILQAITEERQQRFEKIDPPEKIKFYIIYATSSYESTANFEKLIKYIKIYGNAETDLELYRLLDYMANHREQCKRYEAVNLATLKLAVDLLAKLPTVSNVDSDTAKV